MRGGKRENSGRKKKEETATISFRITKRDKILLKGSYQNLNSLFCKFVDYLKINKDELLDKR